MKVESQLEAVKERVLYNHIIHCNRGWLKTFLMEQGGEKPEYYVLKDVRN